MATIAIDWDDTYTADPPLWDAFIASAKERGHRVVCVTCRRRTDENLELCQVPDVVTYFTALSPKQWYMREKWGVNVDIWIDDTPLSITEGR